MLVPKVKRRFIRQNREISRANSTQSLRIGNLETEISRLLAENIAIREQAISNEREAERLRSSQRVFKDVSRLKEQLESKLAEIGTLVTEIGTLPGKAKRRSSQQQRRKSGLVDLKTSPDDQNERRKRASTASMGAGERYSQDGRLPVITEGKAYPRRTLESLDVCRTMDDGIQPDESPEIGPPPIAHFDVTEPGDLMAHARESSKAKAKALEDDQDHEDDIKSLPGTLERRRKRRASALIEDMSDGAVAASQTATTSKQCLFPKSAAKRDLDACVGANQGLCSPSNEAGSALPRKSLSSDIRPKGSRFTKADATTGSTAVAPAKGHLTGLEPASRKILGPKSTNSPTKPRGRLANGKIAATKGDEEGKPKIETGIKLKAARSTKLQPQLESSSPTKAQEVLVPSKSDGDDDPTREMPVGTDLLSPASTEPSVRSAQPTEAALTASVEDVLGAATADGRTSRRQRGAISYAEPSLRAKMRRPTKNFIPAVVEQANGLKIQQQHDSSTDRQKSDEPTSNFLRKRTDAMVKAEKSDEGSMLWKDLPDARDQPTSPVVSKAPRSSNSSLTAAAGCGEPMMEEETPTMDKETDGLKDAMKNMSVFDGPDSSPRNSPDAAPSTTAVQSRKSTRRHSSNPAGLRRVGQHFEQSPLEPDQAMNTTTTATNTNPTNHNIYSERPQRSNSVVGNYGETPAQKERADVRRSASVSRLKSSGGGKGDGTVTVGNGVVSGANVAMAARPERSSVRSSMMF